MASTSYASPKLFSMKAMRRPSGDHEARSPKWVSRLMFDGRLSSGLPVFVPCGTPAATPIARRNPSTDRMARIATDLPGRVKHACYDFRPMKGLRFLCILFICLVPPTAAGAQAPAAAPALSDLSKSLQDLSAKVSPSVVQIFVTGYAPPDEEDRAATGEPQLERSSGSGVIVDADGYIVTNAHVVENATRVEVELPFEASGGARGRSILKRRGRTVGGQIVSIDHETDIAVVKVDAHGLPTLTFGDSDSLRSGQIVLAFGSPLGLESSVWM